MSKILLLGGTGTLSKAVLAKSLEEKHEIWIFNRGNNNKNLDKKVNIIIGDFNNRTKLKEQFKNETYDIIIDFLSRTPSDINEIYPIFMNKCKQYIFISSACVYKRNDEDFPLKENSPKPNTDWIYNIEKFECEKRLIALSQKADSFYTIIRPYITYDNERIPFGITPAYKYHRTIIERIKNNKPMFIWGNEKLKTTVTYVNEFAIGVVGLFLNTKAINEDFHITSDYNYTIKDVLITLYEKLKVEPNIIHLCNDTICNNMPNYKDMLLGDRCLNAIFDNSKIKDAVPNLKFEITIEEGINKIVNHYNQNNEYKYDFKYDAQVDKLIAKKGIKLGYKKYKGSTSRDKKTYYIYRYLPYRFAQYIYNHILNNDKKEL